MSNNPETSRKQTIKSHATRVWLKPAGLLLLITLSGLCYPAVQTWFRKALPVRQQDALAAFSGSAAPILLPVKHTAADSVRVLPAVNSAVKPAPASGSSMPPVVNDALSARPVQVSATDALIRRLKTRLAEADARKNVYLSEKRALEATLKTREKVFAGEKKALETHLKTLKETLKKQQKQASKPDSAVLKPAKTSTRKAAQTTSMPPFTLVSIDHWGTETHAVVRYQGALHTLVPGHSVMGWTVDHVNDTGDGVYVASQRGKTALLALK